MKLCLGIKTMVTPLIRKWEVVIKQSFSRVTTIISILSPVCMGLFFSSYGSAQSALQCAVAPLLCNSKYSGSVNDPKCYSMSVQCNNNSIVGYVPTSAKIKYLTFNIVSPDGTIKKEIMNASGTVGDLDGHDFSSDTGVLMNLMSRGALQNGDRVQLDPNGIGISEDTKFAKQIGELSSPSASTLAQALSTSGETSSTSQPSSNLECNYITAPSVIAVPCDKDCGVVGARCPISGNSRNVKKLCVGSAKCRIGNGEVEIKSVHCYTNIREWAIGDDRCPSATDCILDKTVQAIPWNPNNDLLRKNNARSMERGTPSQNNDLLRKNNARSMERGTPSQSGSGSAGGTR